MPVTQKTRKYKNRKAVTICNYPGCGARLHRGNQTGLCRSDFMRSLHEDEAWEAGNRERSSKRLKALHANPEFAERHSERMRAVATRDARIPERIQARAEGLRRKFATDSSFAAAHAERGRQKMKAINSAT